MKIDLILNAGNVPVGKLADAELQFTDGPLAGLRLTGFAIWERSTGERNVTFPAKSYTVNGERRSFAHLRTMNDPKAADRLRDAVLAAYDAHVLQVKGSLL